MDHTEYRGLLEPHGNVSSTAAIREIVDSGNISHRAAVSVYRVAKETSGLQQYRSVGASTPPDLHWRLY